VTAAQLSVVQSSDCRFLATGGESRVVHVWSSRLAEQPVARRHVDGVVTVPAVSDGNRTRRQLLTG